VVTRTAIEETLAVSTTVNTLDEALTFTVQVLDTHHFLPASYRIEIVSVTEESDDADICYFEVSVQGVIAVERIDERRPRLEPEED
jgi:hypothetical protein